MRITGTVIGYDPGGNLAHGVAIFSYSDGNLVSSNILTCETANAVIDLAKEYGDVIAVGVDTLTCWSTGRSGWRPADRWLRDQYPVVANSVASPNSLYGSMCLNGISVLISLRETNPNLHVSETHPKALYYSLAKERYSTNRDAMDMFLSNLMEKNIATRNEHEWDAVFSVYAVIQGLLKVWETDLHLLPSQNDERLILPCGDTHYWWPPESF